MDNINLNSTFTLKTNNMEEISEDEKNILKYELYELSDDDREVNEWLDDLKDTIEYEKRFKANHLHSIEVLDANFNMLNEAGKLMHTKSYHQTREAAIKNYQNGWQLCLYELKVNFHTRFQLLENTEKLDKMNEIFNRFTRHLE